MADRTRVNSASKVRKLACKAMAWACKGLKRACKVLDRLSTLVNSGSKGQELVCKVPLKVCKGRKRGFKEFKARKLGTALPISQPLHSDHSERNNSVPKLTYLSYRIKSVGNNKHWNKAQSTKQYLTMRKGKMRQLKPFNSLAGCCMGMRFPVLRRLPTKQLLALLRSLAALGLVPTAWASWSVRNAVVLLNPVPALIQ